jgi:tetratricopeptide (TPR) repeat protein
VARVLTLDFAAAPATSAETKKGFTVRSVLTQVLFWSVIAAATYAYAQRTIEYNQVWKDDNTLFVESLKVCPDSAKMNLQVSKVWSQKGDLKKARRHLERAQAIDPDFCDAGYQDAVLTAAGEGKGATLDLAAEKAVKNLHCIYTNTATLTLLNQIWTAQLQSVTATGDKQRLYREFEKQGKIASKGEVKFLAAQKFIEASSIAFDAQEPEDAISLATQAERIVTAFEKNSSAAMGAGDNEETEVTADLRCRIFTLSGLFRASQLAQSSNKAGKKKKGDKKGKKPPTPQQAETRVLQLLHRAVFRDCREATTHLPYPATGPVTGRGAVAVEHLPIAVNHLVSLWTAQVSPTLNIACHLNFSVTNVA